MSAPPAAAPSTRHWRLLSLGAAAGVLACASACVLQRFVTRRRDARAHAARQRPPVRSEVIVLGCGSSTGVPRASCITDANSTCVTCKLAQVGPPEMNRNWRNNPSLLIRFVQPAIDGNTEAGSASSAAARVVSLQIDVGKTFLASVLRWYPHFGVRSLDGVLITHEHADAVMGMDDIRSLQRFDKLADGTCSMPERLPVHVSQHTLDAMRVKFGYLVNEANPNAVDRKVAQILWPVMRPFVAFQLQGLDVLPLPVLHGEDYISLGFLFGSGLGRRHAEGKEACLYISDVSRIPEVTWQYLCTGELPQPPITASSSSFSLSAASAQALFSASTTQPALSSDHEAFFERFSAAAAHPLPSSQSQWAILPDSPAAPSPHAAPRISLLVIDSLFPELEHNTHFNLPQALEFIERLKPKRAVIVGMSDLFEYARDNAELKRRRATGELTVDVELAFDGMQLPLDL